MIIGLSGHIKCGKSTAATLIKKLNPSFQEKYFAYKLKLISSILTGDEIKNFETQQGKDGYLLDWGMTRRMFLQQLGTESMRNHFEEQIWIKALFADYKKEFGGAGMTEYDLTEVFPNWIISDVRFVNEANAIKERNGLLVRVNRPFSLTYPELWSQYLKSKQYVKSVIGDSSLAEPNEKDFIVWLSIGDDERKDLYSKISHTSETELDEYDQFDLVINNTTTLIEFEQQLKTFLIAKHIAH